jgi:predicted RNase H-like HicB family nuclease
MNFTIEFEPEADGRWLAEVIDFPGVMVYGQSREEAIARVRALALRVIADQIEQGGKWLSDAWLGVSMLFPLPLFPSQSVVYCCRGCKCV